MAADGRQMPDGIPTPGVAVYGSQDSGGESAIRSWVERWPPTATTFASRTILHGTISDADTKLRQLLERIDEFALGHGTRSQGSPRSRSQLPKRFS